MYLTLIIWVHVIIRCYPPHVYSVRCGMFLNARSLIFQPTLYWPFLLLKKKNQRAKGGCLWQSTDVAPLGKLYTLTWALPGLPLYAPIFNVWYFVWTWSGLWLRRINHTAKTRQRMRTTGFWRLQNWPHVRVVSVIALWMMGPVLISFHSSLLCCHFFPLPPREFW